MPSAKMFSTKKEKVIEDKELPKGRIPRVKRTKKREYKEAEKRTGTPVAKQKAQQKANIEHGKTLLMQANPKLKRKKAKRIAAHAYSNTKYTHAASNEVVKASLRKNYGMSKEAAEKHFKKQMGGN